LPWPQPPHALPIPGLVSSEHMWVGVGIGVTFAVGAVVLAFVLGAFRSNDPAERRTKILWACGLLATLGLSLIVTCATQHEKQTASSTPAAPTTQTTDALLPTSITRPNEDPVLTGSTAPTAASPTATVTTVVAGPGQPGATTASTTTTHEPATTTTHLATTTATVCGDGTERQIAIGVLPQEGWADTWRTIRVTGVEPGDSVDLQVTVGEVTVTLLSDFVVGCDGAPITFEYLHTDYPELNDRTLANPVGGQPFWSVTAMARENDDLWVADTFLAYVLE
jgi:hypothetical protein